MKIEELEKKPAALDQQIADREIACGQIPDDNPLGQMNFFDSLQRLQDDRGGLVFKLERAKEAFSLCELGLPGGSAILNAQGKRTFLRVHHTGGFGDPNAGNFLEGEVVFGVDSQPRHRGFGFKLRDDAEGPAHQGMLNLLREAFVNELTVSFDNRQEVQNNGQPRDHAEAFRIVLLKDA